MTGTGRSMVVELGAGTGKLTEVLQRDGHELLATDPLPELLRRLTSHTGISAVAATAEQLPLRSRSVDVVVCGQSFHWFDHEAALPEIARVLRPGGVLALAWNDYDQTIPWVRRFNSLISGTEVVDDLVLPLLSSPYFGFVEERQFRFWQVHTATTLADLARSVSTVATMAEPARAKVLAGVAELYAEYGRGHDGMQLPWVTRCYRAVVRHQELAPEVAPPGLEAQDAALPESAAVPPVRHPPEDPGMQLIDFS